MCIVAKRPINLYLDTDDLEKLAKIAERHGDTSPSRIIRQLVREYLEQLDSTRKKGDK